MEEQGILRENQLRRIGKVYHFPLSRRQTFPPQRRKEFSFSWRMKQAEQCRPFLMEQTGAE